MLTRYSNNGSQRDRAYHQLRELLILKQLTEGARLSESEWTDRLNVNRSALREAFVRLEAEGLIEAGRKSGYVVPALAVEDYHEILAVRFGLESVAIDIICQSGLNDPQRIKPMYDVCDLLERLLTEEYRLSVVEADRRFHQLLITTTGNKRLRIAYTHTPLPIIRPDVINAQLWEERVRRVAHQHRAVLKNIQAGNADQARKSLKTHLEDDLQDMDTKTKAGRPVKLGMRKKR